MSPSCVPWPKHVCATLSFRTANPFDLHLGFGVEALKQVIPEVVNMILPMHDSSHQQAASQPRTLSSLLGPAFAVRVLANNGEQTIVASISHQNSVDGSETLREEIRQTAEYRRLKHLFLFGDLLGTKETPIWQVRTPTRGLPHSRFFFGHSQA